MHHDFVDKLAQGRGPLRDRDPRVKIAVFGAIIVVVALGNEYWRLAALTALLLSFAQVARLPLRWVGRRTLVVLPFAGVLALAPVFTRPGIMLFTWGPLHVSAQGIAVGAMMLARAWIATLAIVVLISTTRFSSLVAGLQRLGLPSVLVMVLSFLYRYLFVLVDEAMRMRRAAESRGARLGRVGRPAVAGALLGSLFLRTWDRAERVYLAMVARGFTGHVRLARPLRLRRPDIVFLVVGLGVVGLIAFGGPG